MIGIPIIRNIIDAPIDIPVTAQVKYIIPVIRVNIIYINDHHAPASAKMPKNFDIIDLPPKI